jgi:hypothetical protein
MLPFSHDMKRHHLPRQARDTHTQKTQTQDGVYCFTQYAHTGVMGYARIRWVDMDAYENAAAARSSGGGGGGGGDDSELMAKLAGLLINLDLTPTQLQQLQQGLKGEGVLGEDDAAAAGK